MFNLLAIICAFWAIYTSQYQMNVMKSTYLLATFLFSAHLLAGQIGDIKLTDALKYGANDRYGTSCGIAGSPPEARKAVEQMIQNRDVAALEVWLESPNLVKMTYAAEAFIRLSNEIALTPELTGKIKVITSRQDLIPTCVGCTHQKLTIAQCLAEIEPGQDIQAPHDQTSRRY